MKNAVVLGFLIVFLVEGCATTPVIVQKPSHLPLRYIIDKVPQLHQGRNECGPTALAMVLNYWGLKKNKDELKDDLRWHQERGLPPQNMFLFPYKKYGLKLDFVGTGSIDAIMECVSQDQPVIVRQYTDYDAMAKGFAHWRVVIGYDHEKGRIYLRDPLILTGGSSRLSYKAFLDLWDMSNHSNPSKNLMFVFVPEK